jgi:hypothetical protein
MAQWHRLAQFHPSTRKNPLQSSARAIRCAKLCHRLAQCTGHKQFVFPQIFSSFPQNSTTERQPSQSGGCLPSGKTELRYRHVLIPLVHIDGRTMPNVFPQIFSSFPQNSTTEGSLGTAARGPSSLDNRRRRARHLACHHVPFPTVPRSHHGKRHRIRLIGSVFLVRRHVLAGFAQYAVEGPLKSPLGEDDERLSASDPVPLVPPCATVPPGLAGTEMCINTALYRVVPG